MVGEAPTILPIIRIMEATIIMGIMTITRDIMDTVVIITAQPTGPPIMQEADEIVSITIAAYQTGPRMATAVELPVHRGVKNQMAWVTIPGTEAEAILQIKG